MKMFALFLFFIAIPLLAADPVVELNSLPPDEQLELYEDSEGLFVQKVMEYYDAAVSLRSQIQIMGHKPQTDVYPPSFEEMQDMDVLTIKKYYALAKALHDEVLLIPDSEIVSMKKKLAEYKKLLIQEQEKAIDTVWEISNDCIEERIELINRHDSICNERIRRMEEYFTGRANELVTILSFSVSENLFLANADGKVSNDPSLGVRLNLNLYKVLGFWQGLDVWYDYIAPRITTKSRINAIPPYDITEDWNSNLNSFGLSSKIRPMINTENYSDGFKIGLGYFWAKGSIYNKGNGRMSWSGIRGDFEYYGGNFSQKLPIEIFIAVSIYHSFDKDLLFEPFNPGSLPISLGKTQFGLSLGLRYNFWRSPF